ncbi:hypothetical protein JCM10213v2_000095 [Rhodosporidiobolus nylandii]
MELDADRGRRVKYIYLGFLLALLLATITSLALWSSGGRTNTLYLWFAGAGAVGFAVTAFTALPGVDSDSESSRDDGPFELPRRRNNSKHGKKGSEGKREYRMREMGSQQERHGRRASFVDEKENPPGFYNHPFSPPRTAHLRDRSIDRHSSSDDEKHSLHPTHKVSTTGGGQLCILYIKSDRPEYLTMFLVSLVCALLLVACSIFNSVWRNKGVPMIGEEAQKGVH